MTPLYAGIHANRRNELPPSLPVWSGNCDFCQAPIVCHRPTLRRHRRQCQQQGVSLSVVCPVCATSQLQEHGGIEITEFTREVGKHFLRG